MSPSRVHVREDTQRTMSIWGHVVISTPDSRDKLPVANTKIEIFRKSGNDLQRIPPHYTVSKEDGSFFFTGLPSGTFLLVFSAPHLDSRHADRASQEVRVTPATGTRAVQELKFDDQSVRGRVVNAADGVGVSQVKVEVTYDEAGPQSKTGMSKGKNDGCVDWKGDKADGCFEVSSLPARASVEVRIHQQPVTPPQLLVLEFPATAVSGTIVRPDDTGLPGADVTVEQGGVKQTARTDGNGTYRVIGLLAYPDEAADSGVKVSVKAATFKSATKTVKKALRRGEVQTADFKLTPV